jgi:hypothetical protein
MWADLNARPASGAKILVHNVDPQPLVELDRLSGACLHARMLIALDAEVQAVLSWLGKHVHSLDSRLARVKLPHVFHGAYQTAQLAASALALVGLKTIGHQFSSPEDSGFNKWHG